MSFETFDHSYEETWLDKFWEKKSILLIILAIFYLLDILHNYSIIELVNICERENPSEKLEP